LTLLPARVAQISSQVSILAAIMATSAHLAELIQRYRRLKDELADALEHPSVGDFTLAELKRRKLQLKDEMARLAHMECDGMLGG
jgi:hypothetical protein